MGEYQTIIDAVDWASAIASRLGVAALLAAVFMLGRGIRFILNFIDDREGARDLAEYNDYCARFGVEAADDEWNFRESQRGW